jgi:hypothetical protein
MVQRRTISLPDELDARLERLQDRINVSRVCATALEKEIAMLEATPVEADPEVQRLLRRLQTVKERWYDRGRKDGRRWALDVATREELKWAGQEVAKQDGATIAGLAHDRLRVVRGPQRQLIPHPSPQSSAMKAVREFPRSFSVEVSLDRWLAEDDPSAAGEQVVAAEAGAQDEGPPEGAAGDGAPGDEAREGETERAGRADARTIDEPAYWSGWRDAAREIWQAVAPSLA